MKKMRGKSALRAGEPSKRSCNLYLSEIVINKLDKLAQQAQVSKSEFIEQLIRSLDAPETK
jgi:metal-responsive CopG/Arc/MetJ family transcriptional regulator